ncbi:MAG: CARDB domain-containing protein [bacterium]
MDKPKVTNAISRVLLTAAIVILVVLAVIGVMRVVPVAISSVAGAGATLKSSLFSSGENIAISLSNNSVATGEETVVSLTHKGKTTDGTYQFYFDCTDKDLTMIVIDGSHQIQSPCHEKNTITNTTFKVVPVLKNANTYTDAILNIDFTRQNTTGASLTSNATLTVRNGTLRGTSNTVATSSQISTPQNTSTSSVYGGSTQKHDTGIYNPSGQMQKSDLSITMKDAGVMINGVFVPRTYFGVYEQPLVHFIIRNQGNVPTGLWQFNAVLPTNPGQVFPSGIQKSLNPGDVVEYTLTLQNLAQSGSNMLSVMVDPLNAIDELIETNNTGTITLIRQ